MANKNQGEQPEINETLQAQLDAQGDEIVRLNNEVEALRVVNADLRSQIENLSQRATANSATVVTEKPAPPVRPEVEIGGEKFRFKMGEFNAGGKVYRAADVAADQELLEACFSKYPGLFERL